MRAKRSNLGFKKINSFEIATSQKTLLAMTIPDFFSKQLVIGHQEAVAGAPGDRQELYPGPESAVRLFAPQDHAPLMLVERAPEPDKAEGMPINRGKPGLEERPSRSASQAINGLRHVRRRRGDEGQRSSGHGMEQ